MKLAIVALLITLFVGGSAFVERGTTPCSTGKVRGFAVVTGDRLTGPGGIPSHFDSAQRFFSRRYNCATDPVQVRRVDLGAYEVRFGDNPSLVAIASSVGGGFASVQHVNVGTFRISVLGPDISSNKLVAHDRSFTVILS